VRCDRPCRLGYLHALSESGTLCGVGSLADASLRGVINDTNSKGRFDLLVYDDGILAVRGTYLGVALRSATYRSGGGLGTQYEVGRIEKLLRNGRESALKSDPKNFFVRREEIAALRLRKRLLEHSLRIEGHDSAGVRTYTWKPALNSLDEVRRCLQSAYGDLLVDND
jgi:hypothetical protein